MKVDGKIVSKFKKMNAIWRLAHINGLLTFAQSGSKVKVNLSGNSENAPCVASPDLFRR